MRKREGSRAIRRVAGFLALVLAGAVHGSAAEPAPTDAPVVTVNDETIDLQRLESELLGREGIEKTEELVHQYLGQIDWDDFGDDEAILSVGGRRLTRLQLVAHLLGEHAAEVRGELINLTLVRQALDRSGILLDQELLDAEWDRQVRQFQARMAERGETQARFVDYLEVHRGMTRREWMREPGFRMAAALHALVHRQTEVDEETLRAYFRTNEDSFDRSAAARVRVIFKPWATTRLAGQEVIDATRRESSREAMRQVGRDIQAGRMRFATAWRAWGRPHDPQTDDGLVGWVDADGQPERPGARSLPVEAMQIALAQNLSEGPVLLPPIEDERGIFLIRVEDRRSARDAEFAQVVDEVAYAVIEERLETLTQRFMQRLRQEAQVEYHSLTALVEQRRRAAAAQAEAEAAPDEDGSSQR